MKNYLKRVRFNVVLIILLLGFFDRSFGEGEMRKETISSIFGTECNDVEFVVPRSLKKFMKAKLKILDVGNVRKSSYVVRRNTYLGIDGSFLLDDGTLFYHSLVFSISNKATSWEDAKVYRAVPTLINYEDDMGQVLVADVNAINSLVILPEHILTNYLWEISSVEESAWTKEDYEEWSRRMSGVTIDPEKKTILKKDSDKTPSSNRDSS